MMHPVVGALHLGVDLQTTNGWVRWGLPFASGIAAGMAIALVFALVG